MDELDVDITVHITDAGKDYIYYMVTNGVPFDKALNLLTKTMKDARLILDEP